jgi:TPR repeat protein
MALRRRLAITRWTVAVVTMSFIAGCTRRAPDEQQCLTGQLDSCRSACARGVNGKAGCGALVIPYAVGKGVPRDALAARAFQLEAKRSDVNAQGPDLATECLLLERGRSLREACPSFPMPHAVITPTPRAMRELVQARLACDGGDRHGCLRVAELSLEGELFPADPFRALESLEPMCQAGDIDACVLAGRTERAEGAPSERARAAFERACAAGRQLGCAELAAGRQALLADPVRATAALERACDAGEPLGCWWLARRTRGEAVAAQNPERVALLAERYFTLGMARCKERDREACRDLEQNRSAESVRFNGVMGGIGVEWRFDAWARDHEAPKGTSPARLWLFELGCEAGDISACVQVGKIWGGQGDREKAGPILEKACETGHQPACVTLADFLGKGNPRSKDLLHIACAAGFAEGCFFERDLSLEETRRACALTDYMWNKGFVVGAACSNLADKPNATNDDLALACVMGTTVGCKKLLERQVDLAGGCKARLHEAACVASASDCWAAGEAYRRGDGVAKDPKRAAELLERGCKWLPNGGIGLGGSRSSPTFDVEKCTLLAGYYEQGDGLESDKDRAARARALPGSVREETPLLR